MDKHIYMIPVLSGILVILLTLGVGLVATSKAITCIDTFTIDIVIQQG